MLDVLRWLLRNEPKPIESDDVVSWWRATESVRRRFERPIERAIVGGFSADRLGFAFVGGYQAALRALVGAHAPPDEQLGSFCVTEARGNHPRAIEARLVRLPSGELRLDGEKRWATLGPVAVELFVTACEGQDADRKRLRTVRVAATASGVRISPSSPTPFIPEVPHAVIAFSDVVLPANAMLPGDGYTAFVKPFRTVEDVHVHAATLGYLTAVARRHGFPQAAIESLIAAIVGVHGVSQIEPDAAEGHVALAGLLCQTRNLFESFLPYWPLVGDNERERLHRDRVLLDVAAGARDKRLMRAWQALTDGEKP